MGKWRQLSSLTNVSAKRLLKVVTVSTWRVLPSAKCWPSGRRGEKVAPGAWPKAWSRKKQSLRIVFAIFRRQQSSTKKQSRFFTRATPLFQNERQGTRLRSPSLPYWVFLPLPSESVRPVGARSYLDIITKFSQIHRFPIFFSYEAPLGREGSAIIAKVQINTPLHPTRHNFHAYDFSRATKYSRNQNFLLWRSEDICS